MAVGTASDAARVSEVSEPKGLAATSAHFASEVHGPAYQSSREQHTARLAADDARYRSSGVLPADFQIASAADSQPRTYKEYSLPASQAVQPQPQLSESSKVGPYDSSVKLRIQITNVPEVSRPVSPQELLNYIDTLTAAGAAAVRPIETHLAQPNAINQDIAAAGSAGYSETEAAIEHPELILAAGKQLLKLAAETTQAVGDQLSFPMAPQDRAKLAGTLLPMFMIDGKPMEPNAAKQMQLETLTEKELGELGIERKMAIRPTGAGGDWPVINERPSPDVVQQTTNFSCVSACGEMVTNGAVKQDTLITELAKYWHPDMYKPELGVDIEWLAMELKQGWKYSAVSLEGASNAIDVLSANGKPWVADFRRPMKIGHAIVVDGINSAGEIMVRDPQDATRYEMNRGDFIRHWTGRFVKQQEQ